MTSQRAGTSQPAINAPLVVIVLAAIFVGIHVWQLYLTPSEFTEFILTYAFIPGRYLSGADVSADWFPGGTGAQVWTFATYMFLHADWMHLIINCFWMLAFGSVVARRIGAVKFLLFSVICAVAGAALHLWLYWGEIVFMLGASAAISGQMAGAVRFIFARPGNLFQASRMHPDQLKPESLVQVFRNPRALAFVGIWIAINLLVGVTGEAVAGSRIAWEAHLGGFAAGLLLYGFFDRPRMSLQQSA